MKELEKLKGLPLTLQLLNAKKLNEKGGTDSTKSIEVTTYQTPYASAKGHYKPISKIIDYDKLS
jgi:hypothetical protein